MNEKNIKKSKRFLILSILIIVGLIVSLVFFVIKPILKEVYQTKDIFEEDKLKFETIKADAVNSHVFIKLVEDLGKDQALVEKALIKKSSIVVFVQDIEKIAEESNNKVFISQLATGKVSKAPSEETEEQKIARLAKIAAEKKKVRLALEVQGTYKEFLKFLYKLENMTYIFEVESIDIGNSSNKYESALKSTEKAPIDFTVGRIEISFTPKIEENK